MRCTRWSRYRGVRLDQLLRSIQYEDGDGFICSTTRPTSTFIEYRGNIVHNTQEEGGRYELSCTIVKVVGEKDQNGGEQLDRADTLYTPTSSLGYQARSAALRGQCSSVLDLSFGSLSDT